MSPNTTLVRESFNAIKPHAIEVIQKFYEELFTRYPMAKGLFSQPRMQQQQRALVNSLAHIVEFVEDTEHLTDYLRKLGGRHVAYGTQTEHFSWVGESLLATFAYFFDDQWSTELDQSWRSLFEIISLEMQIGMEMEMKKISDINQNEPESLGIAQLAKQLAEDHFKKAMSDFVQSEEFIKAVRDKAQDVLKCALETEAKRMLQDLREQGQSKKANVA